jgi:glucosyl-dolichyl phosphate glucuronosyltransferase
MTTLAPTVPSFSVVICAYTEARWDQLVAAVESVRDQDPGPLEVILVSDHNEGLRARLVERFPDATVVENGERQGLSGARNSGLRVARGDVIAFLDDDARARPGWLRELGATYADPAVLGAGGAIIADWEVGRPRWFPDEFDWVVGCTYRGMPRSATPVRNAIGCNMSFRREVFVAVGGFAHGIGRIGTRPLGGEETELSIRALRHWPDRRIMYTPSAVVDHVAPAARGRIAYFRSRCYAEGLSKAAIAKLSGASSALSTERGYAVRVLGSGVLLDLADVVRRRDLWGVPRAAAIVAGLAITTVGYLVGTVSARPLVGEPASS